MTEKGMNSKYFLTKLEILLLHCLILPFKLVQYIRNAIDNHEQKTHRNRCIGNADRYSECRGQLIMHVVQNAETLVGDDQIKEKKYINDRGGNFVLNAGVFQDTLLLFGQFIKPVQIGHQRHRIVNMSA